MSRYVKYSDCSNRINLSQVNQYYPKTVEGKFLILFEFSNSDEVAWSFDTEEERNVILVEIDGR